MFIVYGQEWCILVGGFPCDFFLRVLCACWGGLQILDSSHASGGKACICRQGAVGLRFDSFFMASR